MSIMFNISLSQAYTLLQSAIEEATNQVKVDSFLLGRSRQRYKFKPKVSDGHSICLAYSWIAVDKTVTFMTI